MDQLLNIFSFASINNDFFITLVVRLLLNIIFLYLVIEKIYCRYNQRHKFHLSFYLVNLLIFFISALLASATIEAGFAFGLFAVFSIIRYRTDTISIKDMTYLFMSIITAVINSLVTAHISIYIIIFSNLFILCSIYILEKRLFSASEDFITIEIEDIGLVHKDKTEMLIEVLSSRTGLPIVSTEILNINYLRDCFSVKAFYNNKEL